MSIIVHSIKKNPVLSSLARAAPIEKLPQQTSLIDAGVPIKKATKKKFKLQKQKSNTRKHNAETKQSDGTPDTSGSNKLKMRKFKYQIYLENKIVEPRRKSRAVERRSRTPLIDRVGKILNVDLNVTEGKNKGLGAKKSKKSSPKQLGLAQKTFGSRPSKRNLNPKKGETKVVGKEVCNGIHLKSKRSMLSLRLKTKKRRLSKENKRARLEGEGEKEGEARQVSKTPQKKYTLKGNKIEFKVTPVRKFKRRGINLEDENGCRAEVEVKLSSPFAQGPQLKNVAQPGNLAFRSSQEENERVDGVSHQLNQSKKDPKANEKVQAVINELKSLVQGLQEESKENASK